MTLLLSAAMIVTFLPVAAFAEEQAIPESGEAVAAEEEALDAGEAPAGDPETAGTAEEEQTAVNEPKSAEYRGAPLRGVINSCRVLSLEDPTSGANEFVVTFDDGSEKTFEWTVSERFPEGAFAYDENTYLYASVVEDDEQSFSFKDGWNNDVEMLLKVFYSADGAEKVKDLTIKVDVLCVYDLKPLAIKFVPADGFVLECNAGPTYLTEDVLFGEGNELVISCEGWDVSGSYNKYDQHYKYTETVNDDGEMTGVFALNGNPERYGVLDLDGAAYCDLKAGEEGSVEFSYTKYIDELDESVTVSFSVPVKATKIEPYTDLPTFAYTGKTITPKFKVYDYNEELLDPSEYTVSSGGAKKMGWYEATITFKDTTKYVDSITAYYSIGPASPKLTKVTAGKKRLTVKWNKMSAKKLKKIDGFYIEVSTDSDFLNIVKNVKVSKKAFKSKKKLIKGLKKGKTYYVRMYSYKNITQNGEKETVYSNFSKVLRKKTK